jgi:hypothetical protein
MPQDFIPRLKRSPQLIFQPSLIGDVAKRHREGFSRLRFQL